MNYMFYKTTDILCFNCCFCRDTFDMHPPPVSPAKGSSTSKKALSMISSPVRGQKKEEGWKEVIRK
jgi:hypothetical protein